MILKMLLMVFAFLQRCEKSKKISKRLQFRAKIQKCLCV